MSSNKRNESRFGPLTSGNGLKKKKHPYFLVAVKLISLTLFSCFVILEVNDNFKQSIRIISEHEIDYLNI